jgi:hypothetical protein
MHKAEPRSRPRAYGRAPAPTTAGLELGPLLCDGTPKAGPPSERWGAWLVCSARKPGRATRQPRVLRTPEGRLSELVTALRAHLRTFVPKDAASPMPGLNDRVLGQTTHEFIVSERRPASMRSFWTGRAETLARESMRVQSLKTAARGDNVRISELERRHRAIEEQINEMDALERGTVGRKELDNVEFHFNDRRAIVTDTTLRPNHPLHNFKTQLYVEIIKEVTGWTDVTGVEFKSVGSQKIIE